MSRIILGIVAGLIGWIVLWMVSEKIIAAIWPAFGVHQKAFENAVKNGGEYSADTAMLLTHLVLGLIVSGIAGVLAALSAGENSRAPLAVGIGLLALGVVKAVMSWRYVPIWFHVIFTAILLPLAIIGGKLVTAF